ncbi:MAG: hypothetical protein FWC10_10620, partial [Lentimicrobiaceae bacterium]|nr:hypothetical protein [Lentimicrobiaceae bacterium]
MAIEGIESKVLWGLAEVLVGGTVSRIKVYGEQVKGSLLGIYSPGDLAIFRPNGYVFSPEKYDSYCTFMAEENPDKKKLDGDDYIIIRNSIKPIPYYNLIEIKNISGKSIPLEKLQEIGVNRNLSDGTYYISITETKELVGPFKKDTNGLIPKIGQHVSVYNISQDFEKLVSIRGNNGTIFFNRPETIFE